MSGPHTIAVDTAMLKMVMDAQSELREAHKLLDDMAGVLRGVDGYFNKNWAMDTSDVTRAINSYYAYKREQEKR